LLKVDWLRNTIGLDMRMVSNKLEYLAISNLLLMIFLTAETQRAQREEEEELVIRLG
jgi:hypothetical protein